MVTVYPVYEYYDDYEHIWIELPEKERARVQYVVLGSFDNTVVICYIPDGFLATISKSVHKKAWIVESLNATKSDIVAMMSKEFDRYKISDYVAEIERITNDRENIDKGNILAPGMSRSGYDGRFDIHYYICSGQLYSDVLIEALKKKIRVLEIRDSLFKVAA